MGMDKNSAVDAAKKDLSARIGVPEGEITEVSVTEQEFPDMSLGAPVGDEMSAQMIASGWRIKLGAGGKNYEYRGDKYQLRLYDFNGSNFMVKS